VSDLAVDLVSFADIEAAAGRIAGYVHRTPVLTSSTLDLMSGAELFFKCENFQKVGAFKMRGAVNAVMALPAEVAGKGVATHSSGNHGQALALAARLRGIPAYVVMPRTAPAVKLAAVAGYGAEIITCEPTMTDRADVLAKVVARTGATFLSSSDNDHIIAGQGTAALELLADYPDLDLVITPVGGGGLLAGTAVATRSFAPQTVVIGAEPAGADDAFRSLAAGHIIPSEKPDTVADGLLSSLGSRNFPLIQQHVQAIWTVDDPHIIAAMRLMWERLKIVCETSSAVSLAAVMDHQELVDGKRVGIIVSGGNVDVSHLPW